MVHKTELRDEGFTNPDVGRVWGKGKDDGLLEKSEIL